MRNWLELLHCHVQWVAAQSQTSLHIYKKAAQNIFIAAGTIFATY